MQQVYGSYTKEDQLVWKTLFDRQIDNLQDKTCTEYLSTLDEMSEVLNSSHIPNFEELNTWFLSKTGKLSGINFQTSD